MVQSAKPNGYARGKHPNSLAVLAANRRPPRRTGAAANPNGRPPAGESFNDALRYFLELPPAYLLAGLLGEWQLPPERNNMRHALALVHVLESAFQWQQRMFLMNKLDGMPKQALDVKQDVTKEWQEFKREVYGATTNGTKSHA